MEQEQITVTLPVPVVRWLQGYAERHEKTLDEFFQALAYDFQGTLIEWGELDEVGREVRELWQKQGGPKASGVRSQQRDEAPKAARWTDTA